jgi:hypothetical protein
MLSWEAFRREAFSSSERDLVFLGAADFGPLFGLAVVREDSWRGGFLVDWEVLDRVEGFCIVESEERRDQMGER